VALLEKRRYLNNRSGDFPQVILIVPSHVPNTLRVECSDPARNPYFPADFLSARFRFSQLPCNCVNITAVYPRARGEC
jgi:hypothetical protein